MFFVVFVVAGCIVYVLVVVVSFIVVFVLCCSLFVYNVCYLSVVLLYYCHWVKAQLQFNKYIYIYIYIFRYYQGYYLKNLRGCNIVITDEWLMNSDSEVGSGAMTYILNFIRSH
jgi:hypothetical protein